MPGDRGRDGATRCRLLHQPQRVDVVRVREVVDAHRCVMASVISYSANTSTVVNGSQLTTLMKEERPRAVTSPWPIERGPTWEIRPPMVSFGSLAELHIETVVRAELGGEPANLVAS